MRRPGASSPRAPSSTARRPSSEPRRKPGDERGPSHSCARSGFQKASRRPHSAPPRSAGTAAAAGLAPIVREQAQSRRLIAIGVDQHDRAVAGRRRQHEPGVGAERDQMAAAQFLHQPRIGDEAGEAEKHRGRRAALDQHPLHPEDFGVEIDARPQQIIQRVREARDIRIGGTNGRPRRSAGRRSPPRPSASRNPLGDVPARAPTPRARPARRGRHRPTGAENRGRAAAG